MHVVLDYRPALRAGTGVGTYVRNLASTLVVRFPQDRYTLFSSSWKDRLNPDAAPPGAGVLDHRVPVRVLDFAWHRLQWPPVERFAAKVDIAHSPSPLLMPTKRARTVVTVHDCYFLRHPEDVYGTVLRDYVPRARQSARQADAVVVVSQASAEEAREALGVPADRIRVTPLGVDADLFRHDAGLPAAQRVALGIDRPFLLFVGTRERRKDLPTLLAAFAAIRDHGVDVQLVLVGPDAPGWKETWSAAGKDVRHNTVLLSHQPRAVVAGLYADAAVVTLPSRWEGFGLTGLEAMACGAPVVASAVGALPETLGSCALFAPDRDAAEFAAQCVRVLEDGELAERMIAAGRLHAATYPWSATAARTHSLYEELIN